MKILIAESSGFPDKLADRLSMIGEVQLGDLSREELVKRVKDAEVLWIRLRHRIDEEVLAHAPRLRVIVSPTTGLDHIDTSAARRRGIDVLSLRGQLNFLKDVRATAEHTIALMLSIMRQIPWATEEVTRGNWERDRFKGTELYGKTIGLIGFGRVGKLVARYLRAFDADILATDPRLGPSEFSGVAHACLRSLLQASDIVSIHAELNEHTRMLIGARELEWMKQDAILVNTSRGQIIDEVALLEALQSSSIRGAALDVICREQHPLMQDNPLIKFAAGSRKLLLTPHIGGCTVESMEKTELFMSEMLVSYVAESRGF